MSKSNLVHLWRFGRTGALIFTLKWLNRAKTGVLHGTPKIFPGLGQGVSRVNKTQVARINWKIKSILSGLVTRRLYFLKKYDTKWAFFPPCRNWPIYENQQGRVSSHDQVMEDRAYSLAPSRFPINTAYAEGSWSPNSIYLHLNFYLLTHTKDM